MKKRGFINAIVLVVITLIILGYFKIDVQGVVNAPDVQSNLQYAWRLILTALSKITGFIGTYFPGLTGFK